MRLTCLLVAFLATASLMAEPRLRPTEWAVPVIGSELTNLFQVSGNVYRSEQPDEESFKEIEALGITTVLNLRNYHSDDDEAEKCSLTLRHVKMNAGAVTQDLVIQALAVIKNASGPVVVHCWHGSDRTGTIVAAYRIVFQNWTKEAAIDEFENGGYGYHKTFYPNLTVLLKNLDVVEVKKQLEL